jgi:ABC-type transporter Mla subunit MlaD
MNMSFLDTLMGLFGKHKDKLPESMNSLDDLTSKLPDDMNSIEEVKAKAQEVLEQHADTIQQVTDKLPGEADDQLVEKAKDAVQ